jgi:transcriptional regulator with XRE-family HTH domain
VAEPVNDEMSATVGRVVSGLRRQQDLTLDGLADRMRALGWAGWTKAVVAALESGRRRVGLADMVGLAAALRVPPLDLLGDDALPTRLNDRLTVPAEVVKGLLAGQRHPEQVPGLSGGWSSRWEARAVPAGHVDEWVVAGRGSLERLLARSLRVAPAVVAVLAHALWYGETATERRDALEAGPSARHWATRRLAAELEAALSSLEVRPLLEAAGAARDHAHLLVPRMSDPGGLEFLAVVAAMADAATRPIGPAGPHGKTVDAAVAVSSTVTGWRVAAFADRHVRVERGDLPPAWAGIFDGQVVCPGSTLSAKEIRRFIPTVR